MNLFRKKDKAGRVDLTNLPRHIAIIMDGNGRWATRKGLARTAGHAAGAETFRRIASYCRDLGVEYLTVYAFSTENWKRPQQEIDAIMNLLEQYLEEAIEKMTRERIRLKILGDVSVLCPKLQTLIDETNRLSAGIDGVQANLCINYGSRDELVRAAAACAKRYAQTGEEPDEAAISDELYTAGMPDPDLLIRPGGEVRLSNFLLWQAAYAELYFTDVLWPDFTEAELDKAIITFQHRSRRFGGLKG